MMDETWEKLKEKAKDQEECIVVEEGDRGIIKWDKGFFIKCRAGDLQ